MMQEAPSAYRTRESRRMMGVIAQRQCEALRLYEPLESVAAFHNDKVPERILRGSNRAGKTLAAAAEVARAVTGQDPAGKYPKENGRCYIVGKDMRHIGEVFYHKLFRAGAFRMLRDADTGVWRAFRPWHDADRCRFKETKHAPPLITRRFIKDIAWENKKKNVPTVIRLRNGWDMCFFSSLAKPPQGMDIDLAWFDEEIVDPDWYVEMSARLLDRHGLLLWSATPQVGTDKLYDLHCEAADQRGLEHPRVREYCMLLADNPYIDEDDKARFAEKMSEDDRRVRIAGEFAVVGFKVYPEYSTVTHGVPWFDIPLDWPRYMVVDPGRQVCAALFAAVSPEGDIYVYDELYIRNCNATIFSEQVAHKTAGVWFYSFIIDHHWGRITETGSGLTVEMQYSSALKAHGVRSHTTGHGFVWGSDDVNGGIEAVRTLFRLRGDDTKSQLRVVVDRLPYLDWELKRYHYQRVRGELTDKVAKRHDHLADCLRYLAMYRPKWQVKPKVTKQATGALRAMQLKREKAKAKSGDSYVRLGPGATAR